MHYMRFSPRILRETSQGSDCISPEDIMFQHREIWLSGEIDRDTADSINSQLLYLAADSPDKEITIYINSPGGQVNPGLAIYDVMQAIPCSIRTVCVGTAASMAALLFSAGNRREILQHGEILIHDPLVPRGVSGSALEVQEKSSRLMGVRKIICSILAKHTGKTLKQIYQVSRKDTWFEAEKAVEFGLADAVIDSLIPKENEERGY
ncbi:ClpP family protease [Lawsonibacter sp. LCP25S3_G6]|uniref:ClpP family protease n=1 Tax=unclassified Lawsonibacter TaxID=2617946 RepID=UPI003F9AFB56